MKIICTKHQKEQLIYAVKVANTHFGQECMFLDLIEGVTEKACVEHQGDCSKCLEKFTKWAITDEED